MASLIPSGSASGTGSMTLAAPVTNSNQTATLPDATGTVMVSGNMPAFSAYASGSQTVSATTWTKVTLGTEIFDTNNNFASSRFTPTVAGYYQINGSLRCSGTSGMSRVIVGIYKNGSEYARIFEPNFTTAIMNEMQLSGSLIIYLNGSTDYVELYGWINGVGTLSFIDAGNQAYTSSMTGCLLRTA
jgi:hypothetical protein